MVNQNTHNEGEPLQNVNIGHVPIPNMIIHKFKQYCKIIDIRIKNNIKKYDLSKYNIDNICFIISENIVNHVIHKYIKITDSKLMSPHIDNFMKVDLKNTIVDFYNNFESYLHGDIYLHEGVYLAEAGYCISCVEDIYRLHDKNYNIVYIWTEFAPMNAYYLNDEGLAYGKDL